MTRAEAARILGQYDVSFFKFYETDGAEISDEATMTAFDTAIDALKAPVRIGRWVEVHGNFVTPGGTPLYKCGKCGGSEHLMGVEYPKHKVICDRCGRVNVYPWDRPVEFRSNMWEEDEND